MTKNIVISGYYGSDNFGDEMILIATLVNFKPEDNYEIFWQYSTDENLWTPINGEHERILTVIIDENNYDYWWRVSIKMEG